MKKYVIGMIAGFALAGCATAPQVYQFDNSDVVDAGFSETWDALIEYFSSRNIPIRTIDRSSGVLYAERMGDPGEPAEFLEYADCGTHGLASVASSNMSLNVYVRSESDDRTRVTVTADFSQAVIAVGAYVPHNHRCNSRGTLERLMIERIRAAT
ncbi:MAG: hypothetical protein JJU26_00140 [Oceanicaulis sp.]|nr:hypothetical protein [Oceanicaulis sp.]